MADGAENNSCCFIARRIADVVVSAGWGEVCFCARVRRGAALDSRSPPSAPAAFGPWKSRRCRPVQSAVQCSVDMDMDETPGGCPQGRTVDGRWSMGKSRHGPRATNVLQSMSRYQHVCAGRNQGASRHMETAVKAGRRSVSGNGGDLLQTPVVSHRPETDAPSTWLLSASRGEGSARLLVHCGGFGFGFLERGEDGPVAKHGRP